MAEVSFLDFPEEEEDHDEILTLDSFPSDRIPEPEPDRTNKVSFVTDLFHQRLDQSHFFGSDPNLGIIQENPQLGLGLGIGFGFGAEIGSDDGNSVDDDDQNRDLGVNCLGLGLGLGFGAENECNCDCGESDSGEDEFFVARREIVNYNSGSSLGLGDVLRIVEIDSCSDSDLDLEDGIDLHLEGEEDYAVDNLDDDDDDDDDEDVSIPLCWDSLEFEDDHLELEPNNDFEWEEVDDVDRVDEREFLSFMADPDEEGSVSVVPISGPVEERLGNLEWEVLPNIDNVGRNNTLESGLGGDHDDYGYTQEYELMFGQLGEGENPLLSRPPASKFVVRKLPSVAITEEDVRCERALCAICKDQMEVNEEVKKLPCSHWYHGDCIIPWLGIRNTCPVCRYELPTDDPDYEQRRSRRAAHQIIVTRIASLDGSDS